MICRRCERAGLGSLVTGGLVEFGLHSFIELGCEQLQLNETTTPDDLLGHSGDHIRSELRQRWRDGLHVKSNAKLGLIRYPSMLDRVFLTRIVVEIRAREVRPMIRWERQEDGNWLGLSGELAAATVTKDESAEKEQWL